MKIFILFFIFSFFLISCKKDKWEEPTNVYFVLGINKSSGLNGKLKFSEGYIKLNNFTFDGTREQSNNVFFSNSFTNGLQINFDESKVNELSYEVPQGTYNRINISFSTYGINDSIHLVLRGQYENNSGHIQPVYFAYKAQISFSLYAKLNSGSSEIILKKDEPKTATIIFDPIYWFEPVTQSLLNNAHLVNMNENQTIVIDNANNPEIYTIISSRISQGVQVIF